MGRARYLVEAVLLEGRSPTRLAREHVISRSWLFELLARYRQGGYPALEPKSRRPKSSPQQVSAMLWQRSSSYARNWPRPDSMPELRPSSSTFRTASRNSPQPPLSGAS